MEAPQEKRCSDSFCGNPWVHSQTWKVIPYSSIAPKMGGGGGNDKRPQKLDVDSLGRVALGPPPPGGHLAAPTTPLGADRWPAPFGPEGPGRPSGSGAANAPQQLGALRVFFLGGGEATLCDGWFGHRRTKPPFLLGGSTLVSVLYLAFVWVFVACSFFSLFAVWRAGLFLTWGFPSS